MKKQSMTRRSYWYELLLLISVTACVFTVRYWLKHNTVGTLGKTLLSAALVLETSAVVWLFRALWKNKWKRGLADGAKRVALGLFRLFAKFLDERESAASDRVLTGKTRMVFGITQSEETELRSKKSPKWRQLKTGRERMRYLYRKLIVRRISRGAMISRSDTPLELQTRSRAENTLAEDQLFGMYVRMRYDEREEPDDALVLELKDELEIK